MACVFLAFFRYFLTYVNILFALEDISVGVLPLGIFSEVLLDYQPTKNISVIQQEER